MGDRYNKAHPLIKSYQSTAWIFIRGAWFIDYLTEIFRLLTFDKEITTVDAALQAYDVGLARHHPWFLQKAAKVGMYACKNKAVFFEGMIEEQRLVL